jgi:hypothetical protein
MIETGLRVGAIDFLILVTDFLGLIFVKIGE